MIDETKQKRRSSSPSDTDNDAYTFHPVTNSDEPTLDKPHCRVLLLDGEYHTIPVDKKAKAGVVINEVFRHLDLKDLQEKEFFSVYYVDTSGSKIFLNPFKQIRKQLPNASSRTTWDLFFGVQFYATNLNMLADEITRYQYVLQICRDIKEKRINTDNATKVQLVGLLVQANCDDYNPEEHKPGYVEPYIDMIYNPADIPIGLDNSVVDVHKEKTGFKPSEADNAIFMIAKCLYKFGQQTFPVSDRLGQSGQIGASIVGLFFHKNGKEFLNIPWQDVISLGYRKKKVRVRYHPKDSGDQVEEVLYLYCSHPTAKLVWRGCVEQHTFFRLERPAPLVEHTVKSYHSFNRNSELRFSRGRTLYQMLGSERKQQPEFQRSLSVHFKERRKESVADEEVKTSIHDEEPETKEESPVRPCEDEPKPIEIEPPYDDYTDDRQPSAESETLQSKIEEALKKMSEEQLDKDENTDSNQADDTTVTVEINYASEEKKSNAEEEEQNDTSLEFDVSTCQGSMLNSQMTVEITKSNPDLTNIVEFSSAEKNSSSFMVMLEETSANSPPPDHEDAINLEGKYRSDSIITDDLGPAAQYVLERSDGGIVTATAVDIEVRTPTPTYNDAKADLIEKLNKVSNVETSSENDTDVTITAENF